MQVDVVLRVMSALGLDAVLQQECHIPKPVMPAHIFVPHR